MNNVWKKTYTLRTGDFDKFGRIQPAAVLDLFQDAAGRHGEELGVGFDAMLQRSYLWVLVRVKFQILQAPHRYQTVTVKTWPLEPNRLSYRRDYCMEDEEGHKLIVGTSEWVVVHSKKRRFLSVPDLYPFSVGFYGELAFEEKAGKLQDFPASDEGYGVNAGFSELDMNDHVNNTKYANYVLDALSPQKDEELEVFQIDYRKEVVCGTHLSIHCQRQENGVLAKGTNADGDTMFLCRMTFRS